VQATTPMVITISRLLGSGGSYIGQRVAHRLGYAYIDRQILRRAAEELGVEEAVIEAREERIQSFWEHLLSAFALGAPGVAYTPPPRLISDVELVETEHRLICELAIRGSSVVLGRGAFHLLQGKVRLFNVFAHASIEFRVERIKSIYRVESRDEAIRMIESSDQERRRYIRTCTGLDWFDARNFHLTIDTSEVDFAAAEELIASMVGRLHPEGAWPWVSEPV
jgi:cytidylate kinase